MKYITLGFTTLLMLFSAQSSAHRTDWTTVKTLLVHDTDFGGCMASFNTDINQLSGGECTSWVSFSCTHELLAQEQSDRLWEAIQLAYVAKKQVRIQVDPNKKHNGHCVGTRIDFR